MKTIEDINLNQWYIERFLISSPKHFIQSSTPTSVDSTTWIREKLSGRYSVVFNQTTHEMYPTFEDPAEATFFELMFG